MVMNGIFLWTNGIEWEWMIFTVQEREQITFTAHMWEQTIFTVHKLEGIRSKFKKKWL